MNSRCGRRILVVDGGDIATLHTGAGAVPFGDAELGVNEVAEF